MVLLGGPLSELYPMIPLPNNMAAITENRKFDKKNHLKSSPLKLICPIGTRRWWNGPCVAPLVSKSYPMTPHANQDSFLPFDTTWIIFKYILHELCF
jgi:hypothetical protein